MKKKIAQNSYKRIFSANSVYLVGSLLLTTLTSGIIASSIHVLADDPVTTASSANASVTVAEACSIISVNVTPHTTSLTNNATAEDVGSTTFTATCNDPGGLAIYAVGYSGDKYGSTNLIGSTGNIATGTNDATSNWAMKLSNMDGYTAPDFLQSTYTAVPATFTKVAAKNSNTTSATSFGVSATYRFHISATQPADTYVGKVKYTMVHPATEIPPQPQTTQAGKICYYPNGANVLGTMGCDSVTSSTTSATLIASNFSREGYGFAGWSTTFDYSDGSEFYGPQEFITFEAGQYTGSNPGLSLYAVWVKSEGSLQDTSKVASVCSRLTQSGPNVTKTLNSVSALTDQRDNQTYAIAKLADGKCWMIENMRLQNTAIGNSDGSLAQGYGGQFAGLADPEAMSLFAETITANTLYSTDGAENTINIGTSDAYYRFPRYNNVNTPTAVADRPSNPTSNSAINSASNASMFSYGNYYTWAAAIADTTAHTSNNTSVANTSICPAGWHLPKGGDKSNKANNDGWSLIVTGINGGTNPANYDSQTRPYYTGAAEVGPVANALRAYPNNFVHSGLISNGSVNSRGSTGYYWSSSAYSFSSAYNLAFSSNNVYPGTSYGLKHNGRAIRCIASGT